MRLVYNSTTRKTENSPGVVTRVPGFGYTATVENVEASQASVGDYFKSIGKSHAKLNLRINLLTMCT